ncbi:hypothetical protein [Parabacteroides sp.]
MRRKLYLGGKEPEKTAAGRLYGKVCGNSGIYPSPFHGMRCLERPIEVKAKSFFAFTSYKQPSPDCSLCRYANREKEVKAQQPGEGKTKQRLHPASR